MQTKDRQKRWCLTNKHNAAEDSITGVVVSQDPCTVRHVPRDVVYHDRSVGGIRAKTLVETGLVVEYEDLRTQPINQQVTD